MADENTRLNWISRFLRKKVQLTYWLDEDRYQELVCEFKELEPGCIVFKNYYTKKPTLVKFHNPIDYELRQLK